MSMPVRLSDDLMELAKSAAEAATRSLTAQVEHWALIGRAVESALDHKSLTALKASSGKLATAIPDAGRRAAVAQAILAAVRGIDRDAIRQRIAAGKAPHVSTKLSKTNPHLRDPAARERAILKSVSSSSAIEGIRAPFRESGTAKSRSVTKTQKRKS